MTGQEAFGLGLGTARPRPAAQRLRGDDLWRAGAAVLVVGLVIAGLIALQVQAFGGNLTGFVVFGHKFSQVTHPPAGAALRGGAGYDGQAFYVQAQDPLLVHGSTIARMRALGAFRAQRMAYPALAFLLAGGDVSSIPFSLLAINIVTLLVLAGGFALYARRRGRSVLWAIALALMPGFLLPMLRDLSDPMATACLLLGVILAQARRRWLAAAALTVAVLTREATILIVFALAAETGLRAWRARRGPEGWRAVLRAGWPIVALPTAAFGAWQVYLTIRFGARPLGPPPSVPFVNFLDEIRASIAAAPIPTYAAWDVIYVLLIFAGTLAAFTSLRRGVTPLRAAACAATLLVLIPVLSDPWGDTRLSAPLFALLLADALQRRHRPTLVLCGAVAAMTLLIPISLPGVMVLTKARPKTATRPLAERPGSTPAVLRSIPASAVALPGLEPGHYGL